MPQVYKNRILKFLKREEYQPLKPAQLAKALGVDEDAYPAFQTAFDELRQAGHVVVGAGNVIMLPSIAGQVVGHFRRNPKGFGFVVPLEPNAHGDLFIPPDSTGDAMTGDVVVAKVNRKGRRGPDVRLTGEIITVMERANNRFVGTLVHHPEAWLVQPDGTSFVEPIVVEDITAKNAREKDKVVVEILSYPSEKFLARGVIIEVLGRSGQYETEIRSIVYQYHLPGEFEADCLEQAGSRRFFHGRADDRSRRYHRQGDHHHRSARRQRFRRCDKPCKKCRRQLASGRAYRRCEQFYRDEFAARYRGEGSRQHASICPARPFRCCRKFSATVFAVFSPAKRRFAKSAYITYDRQDARGHSRDFANSVICSFERLTYEQADAILKGQTQGRKKPVVALLKDMETLAQAIEKRRYKQGMLHLDLPENEIIMDKQGKVVDAKPADTSYPHTIIEMFMVEANEAVASLLDRFNVPFLRRIHPDPDVLSLKNMARLLKAIGIAVPRSPDRHSIQSVLDHVKGTEQALAVNIVVLRSLERALYAPTNIGHYALASRHYCHFTSPIRRYADLLVHRQLQFYLEDRVELAKQIAAGQNLFEVGNHITFTEERADDAEKELTEVLILQMLSKHIGDELACVVTGLTGFGVFAQSEKYGIDGLIKLEDLGPDHWRFNKLAQCIVGERSGEDIRLGRPLRVTIASVDVPSRRLNVVPVEPLGQGRPQRVAAKAARKTKRVRVFKKRRRK